MAGGTGTAVWSPEARRDIDDIWSYYERVAGRTVAENIVRKIGGVVATIEDHPFAGRSRDEVCSRVSGRWQPVPRAPMWSSTA